jgi:hypothetical protein
MEIPIPHISDACLKLAPVAENRAGYPTSQLQKGLVLIANGQELAEEGVGFGAPILKIGLKPIFPGAIALADSKGSQEIKTVFRLNLEETLIGHNRRRMRSESLYRIREHLAEAYRRFPATRRSLTALSNGLRRGFGWQSIYEYAGWDYPVKVHYKFDWQAGFIAVEIDASELPQEVVTEVVVMNEQGAHHFDTYADSSGALLSGEAIGSWEEVTADRASFLSRTHRLAFTLSQIEGARLFRGRELVGSRLAWAGFGYSFPPIRQRIAYTLQIERLL